jgi:hypothetical protein
MLPLFLGIALEGLQTVISDGNDELIDAINFAIESNVFPRGTVRQLCYWHTVSLFIMNKLPWITKEVLKCLKDSLFHMATQCDTLSEVEYHWEEIHNYVAKKFITDGRRQSVLEVLRVIRSKQAHWCRAWYPNARNFGEVTSGRVETENLHHKKDDQVHSRTSLNKTVEADFNRIGRRKVVSQTNLLARLRHPILETIKDQSLPIWVHQKLLANGAKLFQEQWSLSHNYIVTQLSASVLRVTYSQPDEKADATDEDATHKCHTISIVNQFMQCHCIFVISHTMICRHLLAAMHHLNIEVQSSHIHLRWHKSWMNGMFLSIYHRGFNDGINSIGVSFSLPILSSDFLEEDDALFSLSSPSSPSFPSSSQSSMILPSSPSSSQSAPAFQPYFALRRGLESFTKDILDMCAHSEEASKWALQQLPVMQQNFIRKYSLELLDSTDDGRVTSDLPLSRKRAKYHFERVRKKSAKYLKHYDTYHDPPSSSSRTSPPRTRSQSKASTPPLFVES